MQQQATTKTGVKVAVIDTDYTHVTMPGEIVPMAAIAAAGSSYAKNGIATGRVPLDSLTFS